MGKYRSAITSILAMAAMSGLGLIGQARADIAVNGNFGPNGDVGFANSPPTLSITFGPTGAGSISQMDGFVNASNANLNNNTTNNFGTSAELTYGPPTGMSYTFGSTQPTPHELLLTYTFVNTTGMVLNNFQFMHFVDADIGPNFADEWATTSGTLSSGPSTMPHSFQVGDPANSTIFTNLAFGTLNNTNAFPNSGQHGDVSVGLGLLAGTLGINQKIAFQVLLSDDGTALPGFSVTQHDPVFTTTTLTISAAIVVPEPSSLVLGGMVLGGLFVLRRRTMQRVESASR
jgi:hypothetical protein